MQLNITGHQIEVTQPIKNYVNTKFERIKRHFDQVLNVHVILSVEKLSHKAEATMHICGRDFFADSVEPDLYASIDFLIDKLDKQVRRHKDKSSDKHRAEAFKLNSSVY